MNLVASTMRVDPYICYNWAKTEVWPAFGIVVLPL